MKTKQCLVIVMTLLCLCVKAQNLRVTGVVRDKSDVIIGASVMVKNSTVGTVTDMDGRYSEIGRASCRERVCGMV